jgi:hypothetical protein
MVGTADQRGVMKNSLLKHKNKVKFIFAASENSDPY